MTSIKQQFDAFHAKATQQGRMPITKEGAMRLGFFAGWAACIRQGNHTAHSLSDLEIERDYKEMKAELAAMFAPGNIKKLYEISVVKRTNGKRVKA